ncbi:Putative uncharacterized protein [Staphylococcus xylosus]|nr:Putative uncharacterized protein [Staphylococcus xylosus]
MLSQWERWKEIISKYKILFTFISIALLLGIIFYAIYLFIWTTKR